MKKGDSTLEYRSQVAALGVVEAHEYADNGRKLFSSEDLIALLHWAMSRSLFLTDNT